MIKTSPGKLICGGILPTNLSLSEKCLGWSNEQTTQVILEKADGRNHLSENNADRTIVKLHCFESGLRIEPGWSNCQTTLAQ